MPNISLEVTSIHIDRNREGDETYSGDVTFSVGGSPSSLTLTMPFVSKSIDDGVTMAAKQVLCLANGLAEASQDFLRKR